MVILESSKNPESFFKKSPGMSGLRSGLKIVQTDPITLDFVDILITAFIVDNLLP